MGSFRHVQNGHYNPKEIARRAAKRAARQAQIYEDVASAITATAHEPGSFQDRHAYVWNAREERGGSRKISGSRHPGMDAASFVAETFGSFNIHGTLAVRFSGMNREAGYGAHGITDGSINIEVSVRPLLGMEQVIDVPVTVKQGYMLQPGLFYHKGTPFVLSQSALDDVMEGATFEDFPKASRKHLFCPPEQRREPAFHAYAQVLETRQQYDEAVQDWGARQQEQDQLEQRRKQRRLNQQPGQLDPSFGTGRQELEFEGAEEGYDDDPQALRQRRGPTPGVHRQTFEPDPDAQAHPSTFGPDYAQMTRHHMQPGAGAELQQNLMDRRKNRLERLRRLRQGAVFARLACNVSLPSEEVELQEGSLVSVIAERQEGLHVQHESGQELIVQPSWLSPVDI